jgi:DNA segregation ATPase FtsK/SpoIIIE, S-DNA-T family
MKHSILLQKGGRREYSMNIIEELMKDIRETYLLCTGQRTAMKVYEVIDALWKDDRRPLIHRKEKTADGSFIFTIALPPQVSFKDFYAKMDYFKDYAGGTKVHVDISQSGSMAVLKITTKLLDNRYDYPADFARHGIMPVPIGYSMRGLEIIDLQSLPHLLIGGTPGSGKSTAIHVLLKALLSLPVPPLIVIIDLKVVEYQYLSDRVLLVTDGDTATQCLARMVQEMRSRLTALKCSRCVDIKKYRQRGGDMGYVVIIIDELAELKERQAHSDLETLLRLSRNVGYSIVTATQRPSASIFASKSFGDAKSCFTGRLCYRTIGDVDSRIVLDSGESAKLPMIPGRAYMRLGCELREIQTPFVDPEVTERYVGQFSPPMLPS